MTTWGPGADAPAGGGSGRYRLDLLLDRSPLGDTWHGWDLLDRQAVTVRVVRLRSRLLRERWAELEEGWRQALLALRHPALVRILDLVADDGEQVLMVSELHGGAASLRELGAGTRPAGEAAALLAPIADALASVHRVGLPHLALSPAWVLVGRNGETWLDGCGLAPLADASGHPRVEDAGEARYRAPEQTAGDPGGPSADLFALGRILLDLLEDPVPDEAPDEPVRRLARALVADDPTDRPSAREAADRLTALAASATPPRPATRRPAVPILDAVEPEPAVRPALPGRRIRRAPAGAASARRERIAKLATRGGAVLAIAGAVGLALALLGSGADTPAGTTTGTTPPAGQTTTATR